MLLGDDATSEARADAATKALRDTGLGPVEWVATTGSTNADLLAAGAKGAPHGLIRVADHQRAGRGRLDRTWTTAAGDALLFSVLLRPTLPPDLFGSVTAAVGVAAAQECGALGFAGVGLKWPNDLVVGPPGAQRKLAGILAQSQLTAGSTVVVVGLGLNLRGANLGSLRDSAAALDDFGPAPHPVTLLVGIATRLSRWLAAIQAGNTNRLWESYRELSATLGSDVRVVQHSGSVEGRAVDITPAGALVIEARDGRHEVVVGDIVSLRPIERQVWRNKRHERK